jgi:hypothetical protein
MSRDAPRLDWDGPLWEARGYLGLDANDPVPLGELCKTAKANGWSERELREAKREATELVNVGTLDEPRVVIEDSAGDHDCPESDSKDDTSLDNERKTDAQASSISENRECAGLDTVPEIESGVFPEDLQDVAQWLAWKATDDGRKVPRAPYETRQRPSGTVSLAPMRLCRPLSTATRGG